MWIIGQNSRLDTSRLVVGVWELWGGRKGKKGTIKGDGNYNASCYDDGAWVMNGIANGDTDIGRKGPARWKCDWERKVRARSKRRTEGEVCFIRVLRARLRGIMICVGRMSDA